MMGEDVDPLLEAGMDILKDYCGGLPMSSYRNLANEMLNKNKLGDDAWCNRRLSKEHQRIQQARKTAQICKHAPFTNLCEDEYDYFIETYPWAFELAKAGLQNAEDCYPNFLAHFLATMVVLGQDRCESAPSLYDFVTSTEEWKSLRVKSRRMFRKHIRAYRLRTQGLPN